MSRKKNVTVTIAVSVSLIAHGLVARWAIESYTDDTWGEMAWVGRSRLPRGVTDMTEGPTAGSVLVEPPVTQEEKPDRIVEPAKPPEVPKPQEKKPERLRDHVDDRLQMGDALGGGEAATRAPGVEPMKAPEDDQIQADLGVSPQGAKRSGQGGNGAPQGPLGRVGPPGVASAQGQQASPHKENSPTPDRPQANQGGNGLMKEGPTPPPMLGVDKELPLPPKPMPKAVAPAQEVLPKALAKAREGDTLRESQGKAESAQRSKESLPDAKGDGKLAEATLKPADKAEDRTRAGSQTTDGGRAAGSALGAQGITDKPESPRALEQAREKSASANAISPKGDESSAANKRVEGIKEKPLEEGKGKEQVAQTPGQEKGTGEVASKAEVKEQTKPSPTPEDPAPSETALASAAPTPSQQMLASASAKASAASPSSTGGGAGGDGLAPGMPAPPGETSLQSDTESDPFTKVGSLSFKQGKVDARFGRKVKWVRPRLNLAGQMDAGMSAGSAVVISVSIDATGRVTKVDVLESSGSPDSIDLPVVRAVYAWWIEPPKNRAGEPIPDTMVWRIELKG